MKIMERKFLRDDWDGDSGWFSGLPGYLWICDEVLSAMFEIPHRVKAIWLSLHDRTSPNRHSAKVKEDCGEFVLLFEEEEFDSEDLDKVLKPFAGKTVHLQCEYMA